MNPGGSMKTFADTWAERRADVVHLAHVITKGAGSADDVADLVALGQVALWHALERYDPSRGDFWPYARARVRGAMLDALRAMDHLPRAARHLVKQDADALPAALVHRVSFDEVACAPANDNYDPEELAIRRDAVAKALGCLCPRQALVVARTYLGGMTLLEVAREMGTTESRVCQIRTQALRRISRCFAEGDARVL